MTVLSDTIMTDLLKVLLKIRSLRAVARDLTLEQLEEGLAKLTAIVEERRTTWSFCLIQLGP